MLIDNCMRPWTSGTEMQPPVTPITGTNTVKTLHVPEQADRQTPFNLNTSPSRAHRRRPLAAWAGLFPIVVSRAIALPTPGTRTGWMGSHPVCSTNKTNGADGGWQTVLMPCLTPCRYWRRRVEREKRGSVTHGPREPTCSITYW